ncbi:MAG: hypothetical protein J6T97_07965 [Bacteroidaceae bacterium]|nr:hypothetical protein [Bacteroidaceae bacterium]
MKTVLKPVLAAAFLLFTLSVSAQRSGKTQDPTLNKGEGLEMSRKDLAKMRNQNQDKNARQVDVYMYASSFSLLDSALFVTDIQFVEGVTVNNKWFIKDRLVFEKQFTDYIVGKDVEGSYMTSLNFAEKEKKLIKKRARLIKRNKKKNGFKLNEISEFRFSKPEPEPEP